MDFKKLDKECGEAIVEHIRKCPADEKVKRLKMLTRVTASLVLEELMDRGHGQRDNSSLDFAVVPHIKKKLVPFMLSLNLGEIQRGSDWYEREIVEMIGDLFKMENRSNDGLSHDYKDNGQSKERF